MKIKIICVGKLKEKYLVAGIKEYLKRLQAYCKVEVYEVSDESIPNNCSLSEEVIIKAKEGRRMLDKIKQDDYVILLDVDGKQFVLPIFQINTRLNGLITRDILISHFNPDNAVKSIAVSSSGNTFVPLAQVARNKAFLLDNTYLFKPN